MPDSKSGVLSRFNSRLAVIIMQTRVTKGSKHTIVRVIPSLSNCFFSSFAKVSAMSCWICLFFAGFLAFFFSGGVTSGAVVISEMLKLSGLSFVKVIIIGYTVSKRVRHVFQFFVRKHVDVLLTSLLLFVCKRNNHN